MRLIPVMGFLCCILLVAGCAASSGGPSPGFDTQYNAIVRPYSFNFARWELATLKSDIQREMHNPLSDSDLTSTAVLRYFALVAEMNSLRSGSNLARAQSGSSEIPPEGDNLNRLETEVSDLKPVVEQTLERQITRVLSDQGIYNPFNSERLKLTFPAVKFKLEKPLNLLVVSPRDKIERLRDTVIIQDITDSQSEAVESALAGLNTSALIVEIGGLGATYPSFVVDNAGLRFTLDAAVEEWLHQYLAFKPLGFAYVLDLLGISKNTDISTLNETVAGIAAQELGSLVYNRYYARYFQAQDTAPDNPPTSGFDFNASMREIRQKVDQYLALGQVEAAEKYMQDRQQYLADNGYYIRKLNQAYFAFYGSYAYSPTSIDPLGEQVKSLRKNSASLSQFLDTVSVIKSREALNEALNKSR
jgi:hypothetical protein